MADLKWKIRLARDMAQEALVVIEAPIAAQAEAMNWTMWTQTSLSGPMMTSWATVRPSKSVRRTQR
jgi:hypothetical protein